MLCFLEGWRSSRFEQPCWSGAADLNSPVGGGAADLNNPAGGAGADLNGAGADLNGAGAGLNGAGADLNGAGADLNGAGAVEWCRSGFEQPLRRRWCSVARRCIAICSYRGLRRLL